MINIDPFDPEFLHCESLALVNLIAKHDQYVIQGRYLEARAIERAVGIVYACFKSNFQETQTNLGEL